MADLSGFPVLGAIAGDEVIPALDGSGDAVAIPTSLLSGGSEAHAQWVPSEEISERYAIRFANGRLYRLVVNPAFLPYNTLSTFELDQPSWEPVAGVAKALDWVGTTIVYADELRLLGGNLYRSNLGRTTRSNLDSIEFANWTPTGAGGTATPFLSLSRTNTVVWPAGADQNLEFNIKNDQVGNIGVTNSVSTPADFARAKIQADGLYHVNFGVVMESKIASDSSPMQWELHEFPGNKLPAGAGVVYPNQSAVIGDKQTYNISAMVPLENGDQFYVKASSITNPVDILSAYFQVTYFGPS